MIIYVYGKMDERYSGVVEEEYLTIISENFFQFSIKTYIVGTH